MPKKMLTTNFSLEEFLFSQTAARKGIDNTPDAAILTNLKHVAAQLEFVREALGDVAISISSGYRSPALNKAVGGSKRSAHMSGLAADFTAAQFGSPLQVAKAIARTEIPFDQIIHEYGRWVHLGVAPRGQLGRKELLTVSRLGTSPGLRKVD